MSECGLQGGGQEGLPEQQFLSRTWKAARSNASRLPEESSRQAEQQGKGPEEEDA